MKRIACIDLGTNAIRFIIYEFHSLSDYQVLYKHRAIVRLGQGVFAKGELSAEVLGKIPTILKDYQRKAEELGVHTICCAATSAVREASNGMAFLKEVESQTGLKFRSLSGAQEARILALALQWNKPAPRNLIYAGIDIGGGSTEVFWYHDQGFIDGISMSIGTVRILESLCEYPLSPKTVSNIRSFIHAASKEFQSRLGTMIPHRFFGVSGLIHSVFELMKKEMDEPITYQELEAFVQSNLGLTPLELQNKFQIEKNRSEILLPGCIVLSELMSMGGIRQVFRAEVGLRDGMALEEMISRGESFKSLNQERLRESVIDWAYGLLDKYAGDLTHAQFVEEICTHLFSKLRQLEKHTLDESDLLLLRIAAILHNVGQFVNYINHNQHSTYLIQNSQSPHLTDREVLLVSVLAKYHLVNLEVPPPTHQDLGGFSKDDYQKFLVLLSMLRMAVALDHQEKQLMSYRDIREIPDGYQLIIETLDPDSINEEIRVFKPSSALFSQTFKKSIQLVINKISSFH
jgi:exopolyphosphatase/guanosine-5'-triphosphate,3'-diphosphate pyrophosphatase